MIEAPKFGFKGPIILGSATFLALIATVFVWGTHAQISGAVVAPGVVQVKNNRQVLQHSEGGMVKEIYARDGDRVKAGQSLIALDDSELRTELKIVENELDELSARLSRMVAERDSAKDLQFETSLVERSKANPYIAKTLKDQLGLFETRKSISARVKTQLEEKIRQTDFQIKAEEAQTVAALAQERLIHEELSRGRALLKKGLKDQASVSALEQKHIILRGEIGRLEAKKTNLEIQKANYRLEILKLLSERQEEAISIIRDLRHRASGLEAKRRYLNSSIKGMTLRAPVTGTVYGSTVFAPGSIVQRAADIVSIVPANEPLVVTARISPTNIDQVHIGQQATLRFTSFDQRATPEIRSLVRNLSADVFEDAITGRMFYVAELTPETEQLKKLNDKTLRPGMPVEAYIRTSERSAFSYLTKPFSDYMTRAFRDG